MKTKILICVLTMMLLFLFVVSIPAIAEIRSEGAKEGAEYVPGVLMVKFLESVKFEMTMREGYVATGIPSIDALNKKYGVREFVKIFSPEPKSEKARTMYREMGLGRVYRFDTSKEADVLAMVAEYEADPNVEYAEPDYVGHAHFIPNDPNFSRQWGLYNTGLNPPEHPGTYDADIDATEAYDFWWGSDIVTLAILDTGIDIDHPDFWLQYPTTGVIWTNSAECSGTPGYDDDHNGYVDDCHGYDFVNNDGNPQDDHGHGTNVAGIAGAITHNNVGVAGMFTPLSGNYNIMPVKVIRSDNYYSYDWLIAGINYAVNNGADVINMSLGGTDYSQSLCDAVNYAWDQGCVLVASMGNCNNNTPMYPARFYNTIAVGATDTDDSRCDSADWHWSSDICGSVHGSNYGDHIDVVAPGNLIYSTVLDNAYGYYSGTSQAAPFVSGLAALLKFGPGIELSPDSVRQIIQSTADDRVGLPSEDTPGWDQYYGWGRINVKRALGISAPIFAEDFNDCNLNGWAVYTSSGTFATDTSQWVSPHCGLHMSSQGGGYAYGLTDTLYLDTTQNFTIITYFKVPNSNNHWFLVLDNNWVHLVIDGGTNLRAWQGSHGGLKHLATLNQNQWYTIKTEVKPAFSSYNIYLDCSYVDYAYFLRDGDGKIFPYLRLGDVHDGGIDHGEGYWDDLLVYGKKSYDRGDANGDGVVNIADAVYLINYLFTGGSAPEPWEAGDVNCDGKVDIADVVYLINYLFIGGDAPCEGKGKSTANGEKELYKGKAPAQIGLSSPSIPKDGIFNVPIMGKFDVDVAAIQLEIRYDPGKITLLEAALTSRTEGLTIYSSSNDGIQKIGVVNLSGKHYIPAGTDALVNLRVRGSDLSSLEITNAIFVDRDAQKIPVEILSEMMKSEEDFTEEKSAIPQEFSLSQNYPNPFNPETEISYALPTDCHVKLTIYNIAGRKVKTLVDKYQAAGHKKVRWDGRDQTGEKVASGVYYYRLETEEFSQAKKMVLVK